MFKQQLRFYFPVKYGVDYLIFMNLLGVKKKMQHSCFKFLFSINVSMSCNRIDICCFCKAKNVNFSFIEYCKNIQGVPDHVIKTFDYSINSWTALENICKPFQRKIF